MKRGTPEHPKTEALAQHLGIPIYAACGLLEMMWHWTAKNAIQGNIGKWSDDLIAHGVRWDGEPGRLIAAMVKAGFLDEDEEYRLVIHDWAEHADQSVRKTLANRNLQFVKATPRTEAPSVVYFLLAPGPGCVKIGHTTNLNQGLTNLLIASAEPLQLMGAIAGDLNTEQRIHHQLREYRERNEWFRATPQVVSAIQSMVVTSTIDWRRMVNLDGIVISEQTGLSGTLPETFRPNPLDSGKKVPAFPVPVPVPEPEPEPEPEPSHPPKPPKGGESETPDAAKSPAGGEAAANAIYAAYPRHTQPRKAKAEITHALRRIRKGQDQPPGQDRWPPPSPTAWLLERTREYAVAVARWPPGEERYIPHPSTWFHQARYADDPREWERKQASAQAQSPF